LHILPCFRCQHGVGFELAIAAINGNLQHHVLNFRAGIKKNLADISHIFTKKLKTHNRGIGKFLFLFIANR
jgi:hypothetical protein